MNLQIHDKEKLPKWAQKEIEELENKIARLDDLKIAHAVLMEGRDWFTLHFHESTFASRDYRILFFLDPDGANSLCNIGKNDIVLIGRGGKSQEVDV